MNLREESLEHETTPKVLTDDLTSYRDLHRLHYEWSRGRLNEEIN